LPVYTTNFYCRLALGDGVVDYGTYARQRRSTSISSSSRSCQSQDNQTDETLRLHEEWMQYIISMIQVKYIQVCNFSILYKYFLITCLMTSCSKDTLHTVCHNRRHFLMPPHRAIHQPHTSTARRSMKLLFCIQVKISIIKHE
jgi:hypothetical protein